MNDKKLFIELYFKDWKESLIKTKSLLKQEQYYLEAILILSCYIGAFSNLRYPDIKFDRDKYKKVVLDYSGLKDLYDEVDLLFFYQWPKSDFNNHGDYKELKNHDELVKIMTIKYGDENKLKENIRYISQKDFIDFVLSESSGLDIDNLKKCLPLFTLCELLYRYLRCYAVHNVSFPFVNKALLDDGRIAYRDNHKITGCVLLQTVQNILSNLESECVRLIKWPNEL